MLTLCALPTLQFADVGHYLLTNGLDGAARLWDLRTGRVLCNYAGPVAGAAVPGAARVPAVFGPGDAVVYRPYSDGRSLVSYATRTGRVRQTLAVPPGRGETVGGRPLWACSAGDVVAVSTDDHRVVVWTPAPIQADADEVMPEVKEEEPAALEEPM
jgi:hypothetical protein